MKGGFSFGPLRERRSSAEHIRSRPPPALQPDLGGVASPPMIKSSKESSFRKSSRNTFDHIQEVKDYVRKQNEYYNTRPERREFREDNLKSRAASQGERHPLITDTFGKGARRIESSEKNSREFDGAYKTRATSNFNEKPFSPIKMRSTETSFQNPNPYKRPPMKGPLIASTSGLPNKGSHRPPIASLGPPSQEREARNPIGGALRIPRNSSFSPSSDLRGSRQTIEERKIEPVRASSQDLFKNRPLFSKAIIEQVRSSGLTRSPRYSGLASSIEISANPINTSNVTISEIRDSHTPLESNRKLQEIIKQKDETIRQLNEQLQTELEGKRAIQEQLENELRDKERKIEQLSRRVDQAERGNRFKNSQVESSVMFERERESRIKRLEERCQQQSIVNERMERQNADSMKEITDLRSKLQVKHKELSDYQTENDMLEEKIQELEDLSKIRDRQMRSDQINEVKVYQSSLNLEEKKCSELQERLDQASIEKHKVRREQRKLRKDVNSLEAALVDLRTQNREQGGDLNTRPSMKQNKEQARQITDLESVLEEIYKNPRIVERYSKEQLKAFHRGDKMIDVTNVPRTHNHHIKVDVSQSTSHMMLRNTMNDILSLLSLRREMDVLPRISELLTSEKGSNSSLIRKLQGLIAECSPDGENRKISHKEVWRWVRNLMKKYMELQKSQRPEGLVTEKGEQQRTEAELFKLRQEVAEQREVIADAKKHFHLDPSAPTTELKFYLK